MFSDRSRLLFLLVLVSVAAAAIWTTALADGVKFGGPNAAAWTSPSKPLATPTSGEPDVGQGPRPTPAHSRLRPVVHAPWTGLLPEPWYRWIVRTWMVQVPGAR